MSEAQQQTPDTFDRIIGTIDGLPDVDNTRPAAISAVLPIIGRAQTYVVRTYRTREGRFTIFLELVDAEGRARIVVPDKVAAAIYRQREQLIKRAKTRTGREKWEARKAKLAAVSK
ncbi:MAG TPA: hypothetical protein VGQ86_03340 [Candidatus Limnocylindria bacterium]|jgi:hypothetical protein|nr:hypothetical protein [Candidatus Limnocylindria bacterium]